MPSPSKIINQDAESKQDQITNARRALSDRGVSVAGKQIGRRSDIGIGTWGLIDFLVNHAGYSVVASL